MKKKRPIAARKSRGKKGRAARIRAQVMRDWLGHDGLIDLNDGVTRAADSLANICENLGLSSTVTEESLRESWLEVAGDFVGQHTRPESLKNGILVLHVLQPAMRFHLEQSKAPLLKKLQAELGDDVVRDLRFQLG